MNHNFSGDSRSNQRAKRRKTNLILNSLIVIVLLLIIIVSVTIFFGGSEKASTQNEGKKMESTESNQEDTSANNEEDDIENTTNEEEHGEDDSSSDSNVETDTESDLDDETSTEEETDTESTTEDVVTEGGSDPNVKTTITNPDWQPVGTSQSGEHIPVYDSNSVDWQEMIQAMTYATGLDPSNTTVWFLGRNNESGSQSVGTISSKDQSQIYRVSIEWVDGQGWKPIKVEELLENDRR